MKITKLLFATALIFSTFFAQAATESQTVYYISYKLLNKTKNTTEEGAMSSTNNVPVIIEKYNDLPYLYANKSQGKFDNPLTDKVFSTVKNGYALLINIQEPSGDKVTLNYDLGIRALEKLHDIKVDDVTSLTLPSVSHFIFKNKVQAPIGKDIVLFSNNNYELQIKITE